MTGMSAIELFELIHSSNPNKWQQAVDYLSNSPNLDEDYKASLLAELRYTTKIPVELLVFPFISDVYTRMLDKLKEVYGIEFE